ncbi:MAG TPA: sensor domain-containing diguanylate cyclase [Candidatus Limnocylindria bacterium]|nr:sensor domain-containing diguanylate cyclase [Candidatus Limnocylindria bacterium]
MERTGVIGAFRTTLGVLVAAPMLAVLGVSRALPPADLASAGVGWIAVLLAAILVAFGALAAVLALLDGLRHGRRDSLLAAGASSAVAGGAVGWLAGAPYLLPLVLAAASLLGAAVAHRRRGPIQSRSARAGVAAALLIVVELGVFAELLPGSRSIVDAGRLPLAVAGVALGAAAALLALGRGVGPVATALLAGVAGMALAREAVGIESVIGLAALIGSQLIAVITLTATREQEPVPDDHRLPELASQLPDAILRFDGRLLLHDWNPAAAALLGLDVASAGARLEDLLGVALRELPLPGKPLSVVGGIGGLRVGLLRSGEGLTAVISDHVASPEVERLGRELRGTIEELLQARRTVDLQRQELERASTIDALTGVTSRSAILERLRTEVAQARRYQHPVAVVLLDLDDFAAVNRAHGTAAGDTVLRETALHIRLRVRQADELGRVGSDSFLAVLPHTEESGAATFADALQHRLGLRPITVSDRQITPTASVGVAVIRPGDELDVDALLARADEALASAKRAGGNRIALDRLHGLARLEDRHGTPRPDETDAV